MMKSNRLMYAFAGLAIAFGACGGKKGESKPADMMSTDKKMSDDKMMGSDKMTGSDTKMSDPKMGSGDQMMGSDKKM